MVRNAQVGELVHDHVVEHPERGEHQSPVEGERAARRARAPECPLPSDANAPVRDADALALLLGERRDDLTRADARLRLADRTLLEAESRYLASPLLHDPPLLLREQALHFGMTRPDWHGEPRGLSPRHLES